jgi:hypothetical protein
MSNIVKRNLEHLVHKFLSTKFKVEKQFKNHRNFEVFLKSSPQISVLQSDKDMKGIPMRIQLLIVPGRIQKFPN